MKLLRLMLLLALGAVAPLTNAQQPEPGRLLVSTGAMEDPNFRETVLLVLQHEDDRGSLAVALNRPTWLDPADVFEDVDAVAGFPGTLFRGGPVAPTQLLLLVEYEGRLPESMTPIVGSVYFGTDLEALREIELGGPDAPRTRLYAGYAIWGPGQLEQEIGAGSWRLMRADAEDIFAAKPETLWRRLPAGGNNISASLQ